MYNHASYAPSSAMNQQRIVRWFMVQSNTTINHDIFIVSLGANTATNNGRSIYVTLTAAASIQLQQHGGIYKRSIAAASTMQ